MGNPYFRFKQFTIYHDRCAMKVTTDGCLFGAWCAHALAGKPAARMLDIGTGTGLLSLMVAQQVAGDIDAVEIDESAASQARENVKASPYASSIQVVASDIRNWEGDAYGVIFSNPPFYEKELRSPDAGRNLAHHSDELPLVDLLKTMEQKLAGDGRFYLLLPYKRSEEVLAAMATCQLFPYQLVTVHPSVHHAPFRLMLEGGKTSKELVESTLFIREAGQAYSEAFTRLLQPYYL